MSPFSHMNGGGLAALYYFWFRFLASQCAGQVECGFEPVGPLRLYRRESLALVCALLAFWPLGACTGRDSNVESDPSIALFDPLHVVEVEVDLPPEDWDALRMQSHPADLLYGEDCLAEPFPSPFTYFRAEVKIDGRAFSDVGVRKKGFLGHRDKRKPSLKIKLDKFVSDQNLYGYDRLTLNNNEQDPSHLRQCLAYGLFSAGGVPAPRCSFARVTINGEALGLFSNVESVKKRFLARHFDDDGGMLFEGVHSDFRDGWLGTFEAKTNKKAPDRSSLFALSRVLSDSEDDELLEKLPDVLDLDAFIDFWAMGSILGHSDGYAGSTNNFFVYDDPATGLLSFIPWGVDETLLDSPQSAIADGRTMSVYVRGLLANRLHQLPEVRLGYAARMRQLLDKIWDEAALLEEVERMAALVRPVTETDVGHGRRDFDRNLDRVRHFIETRRERLQPELDNPVLLAQRPRENFCFIEVGTISGSFETTYESLRREEIFATGTGSFDATLEAVVYEALRVGSKSGTDPESRNTAKIQVASLYDDTPGEEKVLFVDFELPRRRVGVGTHPVRVVSGIAASLAPATSQYDLIGTIGRGTVTFAEAQPTAGARVAGTFELIIVNSPW